MSKSKILRITTVPLSLKVLLKGQHRFMQQNGFEVIGVSSNGEELYDVNKDEEIRVIEMEMTRTISPLRDFKSLWEFYKLCKSEKPLIVHSHTPKAGIVGMLGAKLAGVPIRLHTVAGLPLMEVNGAKRIILDMVEKLTYSCATKVYPNSKGLYNFILANKYTSEEKLKVIGEGSSNGIDTKHFNNEHFHNDYINELKSELGISKNDFIFVFVGRLVGDKGINELVKAFLDLQNLKTNVKLLLVGPFESLLDPLWSETIESIRNEPNIIEVGFQKDVRPFFSISNVLVFPSYREGFPNVVMQAGAMGLPSIVSDINGCNEIVSNGKNGIIIPVKNSNAITQAMIEIIDNKDYYLNMKKNARSMIVTRFEQSVIWNSILEEYKFFESSLDKRNV